MNNSIFQKLAVAIAGATLSLTVIEAHPAQAEIITYDFNVDVTSGLLSGQEGVGSFTYDTSLPPVIGSIRNFPVTDFNFSFLNKTYTLRDIELFDRLTQVSFLTFGSDGLLINDSFVSFGLLGFEGQPDFAIANSLFFTSIGSGGTTLTGQGDVTYSLRPTSVPEPGTDFGFSGLGILGLGWLLRKKIASSQRA